ncbi:MAG: hypothetical protein ABSG22_05720 [Sedimentisphaerales bacterium]
MLKSKYLTKKQKGVLEDLFSGPLTVQEVLEKWKVTRRTYFRWHAQEFFSSEFKRLLNLVHSESELICARYSAEVAMKLVSLTVAEKDEIARKACMNVINHPSRKTKNQIATKNLPIPEETYPPLPPEVASRLLAALANEKDLCVLRDEKTAIEGETRSELSSEASA